MEPENYAAVEPSYLGERTERLAYGRNLLLEEARRQMATNNHNENDTFIVVMDLVR